MVELTPTPSLLLKVGAAVAKWALWLLAAAWITLALVWGGLHFLIVPRIGELRPWLEQQASRSLGIPVRIGTIEARSNGLIPSFELRDIRLLDTLGRVALRLPTVLAALSPRSALGLGFEQLYMEGLTLDVRRTADGRIWIAGLPLPETDTDNGAGADWVFSQTELAIRHGTVTWTDELRAAPPLVLGDVDVVLRNRHRTHALRIDATPPPEWGARLSASGVFRQSLLSRRAGQWKDWEGQLYAELPRIDLAQLRRYADVGVDVAQGAGALRAWADVAQGTVLGGATDVSLTAVNVTLDPKLAPLTLDRVSGRIGARKLDGGMEVSTQALEFDTRDGLHWPGGNVRIALYPAAGRTEARGDLTADRLDLGALGEIAARLPLDEQARSQLAYYAPHGLVERVQANWLGTPEHPQSYSAKGRVTGLTIQSGTHNAGQTPGFKGADIEFDLTQNGGKATLAMQKGTLDLLGILDEPLIDVDQLLGDVTWTTKGDQVSVAIPNLRFSNADVQAEAQIKWQTADAGAAGKGPSPGVLDLQGTASRAMGAHLYRYLPREMNKEVRTYLQTAILGGMANGVKFKVKGDLAHFPFEDAKHGDFRISASVQDATFAYAPASVLPKDSLPWPALTQVSGELVIDHAQLQVKGARATLAGAPNIQVSKADAAVTSIYHGAQVSVSAEAKGPLAEALAIVNSSPLGPMTGKVLAHASATGMADYRLKLAFPVLAVDRVTVQGGVTLSGNDLQVTADTPRLTRARGQLAFTESGFSVSGVQARALGGDVRIEGGLSLLSSGAAPKGAPVVLRMQGTATADGLRQAKELGAVARLAQYATGASAYTASLGLRAGVPELQINSSLSGMALSLPAPFAKTADAPLPVRLETSAMRSAAAPGGVMRGQDQMQLDLGRLASITYVRDISGAEARVLRGAMAVGLAADESAPMPAEGVVANISMGRVDLDAWGQVLSNVAGSGQPVSNLATPGALAGMAYLPTSMAIRAKELLFGGRQLNNVVVGGAREGLLWRANLDASEFSGYVEYRQSLGAAAGKLYARLARLSIAQSAAQDVESLLDEQPASIPALDVVVEDFELRGKKLGRVEMDAVNLGAGAAREAAREWRLNRFNISTPEAVLTASGNWTNINAQAPAGPRRNIKERRRTVMNFKLDIADAGDLLSRFGMNGVVRKGRGKIEGQVAWLGSPITLDYPSLGGSFNVNVENGQFLKADPGIAKLLGVLSLQSLPRRLTLDFRDVFSEGFAFDFFRGDITIEQGIARTNNLQMKGVNAAVLMEGQADIAKETQAIKVVVIPEINAGSASLIASAINPLVGLSTFLAQVILRRPLIDAATQELFIDGTWVDPRVTKVERKTAPAKPEETK